MFWYRMVTNDIIHYSDFRAYLLNSDGDEGEMIKRDGFRACEFNEDGNALPPTAKFDLSWRRASYDLSRFRGQAVTLVFGINNLHEGESMGIWTYVDDVRVVDAGPLPTSPGLPTRYLYLPLVMRRYAMCDPIPTPTGMRAMEMPTVRPTRPPTPTPP
jgi:hypothetical protein